MEGPVLLVGHSWGGVVITEAGNHPKVAGLVFVAASAPDAGKTFQDWDYPATPGAACIAPHGTDGYLALTHEGVVKHFVQDLPAGEAELVWATQAPIAARCFGDPVGHPAWCDKPSWYVVGELDETIPPAAERDFAARMGQRPSRWRADTCRNFPNPWRWRNSSPERRHRLPRKQRTIAGREPSL